MIKCFNRGEAKINSSIERHESLIHAFCRGEAQRKSRRDKKRKMLVRTIKRRNKILHQKKLYFYIPSIMYIS